VGNVVVFGAGQYSMRIWLDPNKMQARGLMPQDVIEALRQQSTQVTAGQIGAPRRRAAKRSKTLNVTGRLRDPAQFAQVIVKTGRAGEITRLSDVGRVELGAQTYGQAFTLDGQPAAGLAIYQAPGANALNVAHQVQEKLAVLKREFPQGLISEIPSTPPSSSNSRFTRSTRRSMKRHSWCWSSSSCSFRTGAQC
jgi:hydrophobic/amphiphilic exporter-1 (mainly G- bacteria), HAE1 family